MLTQQSLEYEILQWLGRCYGGRKLGKFMGVKDQWLVCYFFKEAGILTLGTAVGKNEARIMTSGGFEFNIDTSDCVDLHSFTTRFKRLLS